MPHIVLWIHCLVCLAVIGLVLIQQGQAGAGGMMGSGASATMFGSVGAAPFLVKLTTVLALIFFISSFSLSYMIKVERPKSVVAHLVKKG